VYEHCLLLLCTYGVVRLSVELWLVTGLLSISSVIGKGKGHPRTGHEGQEGE
jgi:hypothetical protein